MNVTLKLLGVAQFVFALASLLVLLISLIEMFNLTKRIRDKVGQGFIDETNAEISRIFGVILPCILLLYLVTDGIIILIKLAIGGT